jgi:hypothetical protein
MDLMALARQFAPQVLEFGRKFVDLKKILPAGAPELLEAAHSLKPMIASVRHFADPPTAAELEKLEAEVFAGLDETIAALGD